MQYHSASERKLIYAWEDDVADMRAVIDAASAVLNSSDYSDDERPLMRNLRNAVAKISRKS